MPLKKRLYATGARKMTVIAEGIPVLEINTPPPRKKLCLSLSGRGKTPSFALSVPTAEAVTQSAMNGTVNRSDGVKKNSAKRTAPMRLSKDLRRDAVPLIDTGIMLNGYASESVNSVPASDESPGSDCPPVATLCNLGNTCFLNSILYTLRFAPAFLHNLHHLVTDLSELAARQNSMKVKSSSLGRSVGMNSKNWNGERSHLQAYGDTSTKSRIQVATERLHEVYEALHNAELKDSSEPFQPDVFLHALREVNPMFEGNQQHDAHELLGCLLNYIRDTCTDLAKQVQSQPNLVSEICNGVPTREEVKKEPKGSLLASVGLSSSTSSISSGVKAWGARKSWKRKKTLGTSISRTGLLSRNGQTLVAENGNNVDRKTQTNGGDEQKIHSDELPGETKIMLNGEVAHDSSDGDVANGSCNLAPLIESDESSGPDGVNRIGVNFIADDFEGVMVLCTTCLECECKTEMKETFFEIGVPIQTEQDPEIGDKPDQVSALYKASVVTEELLHNVNKYWCEHCLRYNEARRSVRYQTLPRLLTLQLKRFSSTFGSMVCMSKVNEYMPTPLTLDCFCEQCLHPSENGSNKHRYQLYGVIMHLGATIASGHYVAYVRASDPTSEYKNCDRDKRKTASLITSNAPKSSGSSDGEKVRSLLRFFSPKPKSNATDSVSKNHLSSPYYRNTCRSLDCCGVRVSQAHSPGTMANGRASEVCASEEVLQPVWLECDDETVRVLTRRQLEDVLAPKQAKSSALTPYLLFYVRDP